MRRIELFIVLAVAVRVNAGEAVNIALGKRTTASVNEKGAWGCQHLVDGSYTTCWDVNAWKPLPFDGISTRLASTSFIGDQLSINEWAEIDLAGKYQISSAKILPYSFRLHGPQLATSFALQYHDGEGWREILDTYQVNTNSGPVTLEFEPVVSDRVRLRIYSGIKFAPIAELEIYGVRPEEAGERKKSIEADLGALIGKNDYISALRRIDKFLAGTKSSQKQAWGLFEKARIFQRMGVLREAVAVYRRIARRFPELEKKVCEGIADCYFLENQFNRARKLYEELSEGDQRLLNKARFLPEINLRAVRWRELRGWPLSFELREMRFKEGDNPEWGSTEAWEKVSLPHTWNKDGFGWYRCRVFIPESWKKKEITLELGKISNTDETFLNDKLIGRTGRLKPYFVSATPRLRSYRVPEEAVRFDKWNLITIRVYNEVKEGGLYKGPWRIKAESKLKVSRLELPAGAIFYRGKRSTIRLHFQNNTGEKNLSLKYVWTSAEEIISEGKAELPEGEEFWLDFHLPPKIVEQNGLYSLSILYDGLCIRRVNFAVCPRPESGPKPDSPFGTQTQTYVAGLEACARIGVRWLRFDLPWRSVERQKGRWNWKRWDEFFSLARKWGVVLLPIVGWAPAWVSTPGGTEPSRKHLADWENYIRRVLERYRHTIAAVEVCNEVGIGSAREPWKSTEEKYREMIKRAYRISRRFNREVKVIASNFVSVTGSVMWSDPQMPKYLDGDAPHIYTTGDAFWNSCEYARLGARKFGKESWLTEYWGGQPEYASELGLVKQSVIALSLGVSKLFPFAFTHYGFFDDVNTFSSPALSCVAYAVMVKMLEGKKFVCYPTPDSLPWDFLLEGADGAIAVLWGLNDGYLDRVGEGTISLQSNGIKCYDVLGNEIRPSGDGRIVIPFSEEPFYLTARRKKRLIEAIRNSRIRGIQPVEIMVEDLQEPLKRGASLRVVIRNIITEELGGTLYASSDRLRVGRGEVTFEHLEPGTLAEFEFAVSGERSEGYPVEVSVRTNLGDAHLETLVNEAVIMRGTPAVDGDLSEWGKLGAVPIVVRGESEFRNRFDRRSIWTAVRETELKLRGRWAKFMTLWDDANLYFALEVLDPRLEMPLSMKDGKWYRLDPTGELYLQRPVLPFMRDCFQVTIDANPTYSPLGERAGCVPRKDYEYCFYLTAEGAEAYRCHAPGIPFRFLAPFTKPQRFDQGVVDSVKQEIKRLEKEQLTVYEVALPWKELSLIKPLPGKKLGLAFRVISGDGVKLHYSLGKSTTKLNALTFTSQDYGYEQIPSEETYFTLW